MSLPQTDGKESYRNPKVEEDDDDLDDLDDVLASFNSQPAPPSASVSSTILPPSETQKINATTTAAAHAGEEEDDEDFEASLAQGMESLLRQLAGDHPPGPMPDIASSIAPGKIAGAGPGAGLGGMSKEEEEAAWQKALELVLSGEGLAAIGLDEDGQKQTTTSASKGKESASTSTSNSAATSSTNPTAKPSFEETMRRTLDSLNTAGQKPNSQTTPGGGDADLEALLKSIGGDPDLLKSLNLGEEDGEDGLADVLEGMMSQLMTKEVLEEPMSELATKYPPYLASPPPNISKSDLEKYKQQHIIVQKILEVFKRKDYSDEKDGKEVAKLVGEMQDLGGPPKEVMGDLPEGFDLGALGALGGEDCTIM